MNKVSNQILETMEIVESLKSLQVTLDTIEPLIMGLDKDLFNLKTIGYSHGNKPIYRIKYGVGDIKILLWSQMHGDESTATKSIIDMITNVNDGRFTFVNDRIYNNMTLYIIPMLNPDGAALYTRENLKGNDLNRDAKQLLNNESNVLMEQIKEILPDYAFNLHDQTSYYNVQATEKVASISLLAPAFDPERNLSPSRIKAMSVISAIYNSLQSFIPGNIGRYNDAFCSDCFGDTIQALHIPTILIECGFYPNDSQRNITRKLHTLAFVSALHHILNGQEFETANYFQIPKNEKYFYDLRINNIVYQGVKTDIGIRFKYVLNNNKIEKQIDPTETILGEALDTKYFHEIIDFKSLDLKQLLMLKI